MEVQLSHPQELITLGWAHSAAEGEGTTNGDWWSDDDAKTQSPQVMDQFITVLILEM